MQPISTKTYTWILPRTQDVGMTCLRALHFSFAEYKILHFPQRCRVWVENSASAFYLLRHDTRGNFRHQHCTNGWRIWVEKYVHIFLTTDAQCLQKTSERIFHTDAEYRGKTRSVSSPVQNVGEDYCSTCEVIYQAWDTVFHDQMKHWKESWKYHVQRSVFDHLRSVSSGDETLGRMLDITSQTKWF